MCTHTQSFSYKDSLVANQTLTPSFPHLCVLGSSFAVSLFPDTLGTLGQRALSRKGRDHHPALPSNHYQQADFYRLYSCPRIHNA